jgi:hypothetical protein
MFFLEECVITNVLSFSFFLFFFQFCGFENLSNFPKKREFIFLSSLHLFFLKKIQFFLLPKWQKLTPKKKTLALITCLSIGYTINAHVQNYSQIVQKYYMLFFFHCLPLNPFTMNVARTQI